MPPCHDADIAAAAAAMPRYALAADATLELLIRCCRRYFLAMLPLSILRYASRCCHAMMMILLVTMLCFRRHVGNFACCLREALRLYAAITAEPFSRVATPRRRRHYCDVSSCALRVMYLFRMPRCAD